MRAFRLIGATSSGAPAAKSATAPQAAGAAYTISRLLGSTSTLSLTSGSNANLTISGATVSQTNPIPTKTSQTAIVREQSGSIAIEYPVVLSGTYVPPAVTPLPSGIAAMWDPATLNIADGAAVTSWTDSVGSSVASSAGSSVPHTFVANSGGLPAVRINGGDVLKTTGTSNAAYTAMSGGERTMIVIARNIQNRPSTSANPVLASLDGDTNLLFSADTTSTGFYGRMTSCGDAGMRSIASSMSASHAYGGANFGMDGINGSAIHASGFGSGQINIGGWRDTGNVGRADVLAIIIWNRALTATEFKQVHRHYCDLLSQNYPGGTAARTVSFIGDSLTDGAGVAKSQSWPLLVASGLNLPWGTFDSLAVSGYTWAAIQQNQLPFLGNVSGLTGTRNIVCGFEWANMRADYRGAAGAEADARACIDALHSQDPNREVIFGTSTDDGSSTGVNSRAARTAYNTFWDNAANRSGIAAYVQLHLDSNIGVVGCAPTDGNGNTYYQTDGIHNTAAGYALIDNGPYGFRSAVQARLAAA